MRAFDLEIGAYGEGAAQTRAVFNVASTGCSVKSAGFETAGTRPVNTRANARIMIIGWLRDEEGEGPVNSRLMLRCGRTAVATTLLVGMSACGGGDGSNSEQAGGEVAPAASSATSAPVADGSGVEVVAQ